MLYTVWIQVGIFLSAKNFHHQNLFPSLFRHLKPTLRLVKSYTWRMRLTRLIPVLHVSIDRLDISQRVDSHYN